MRPKQISHCQRLLTNVRVATLDPAVDSPYGALTDSVLGIAEGRVATLLPMAVADWTDFAGEIIDGQGGWVTPGLLDCHTHLVYGGHRAHEFEQRLLGKSYQEIARGGGGILATVTATRNLSREQLVAEARPRLEALLAEGVTGVEIKSGYGLTVADELKILRAARDLAMEYPVRISTTLLAAHCVPPEFSEQPDRYIDMICKELIPLAVEEKLADAIDVFCEEIAFSLAQSERIFVAASQAGLGIKVHAEQLSSSGAAALAADFGAWSADHLEFLDEAGVRALQKAGTVATLLPGAFYFLQETRKPPVALLRQYGVPMALASDLNPGTSPLASLRLMLNMGCTLFGLTSEEALAGVTRNAACAMGRGDSLGTVSIGKEADLLLWDIDHPAQLAGEFGSLRPRLRMVGGEVMHASRY